MTKFTVVKKNNKPWLRIEYTLGGTPITEERMIYGIKTCDPYINYSTPITGRIPLSETPELINQLNELLAKRG